MVRPVRSLVHHVRPLRHLALRTLILWLGITAYATNGAQAHLIVPAGDTVEVRLCGAHGGRTVTIDFGDGQPIEATDDSCCGPCLISAPLVPEIPALPKPVQPVAAPAVDAPRARSHIVYSIWPGAPPHGPPAVFERHL
ncbi:hypothetical protein [Henriciella aquimarina]|uniref:hypothetical protein n=1 Tax=Henriciella aquimarina TaxID=545261 RepID=UPI000A062C27|nr:hypothetical protein [Henriciella aquimarina]